MTVSPIAILDDDFDNAAAYYITTLGGTDKNPLMRELKRQWEEEHQIDPLVWLFTKSRIKHQCNQPVVNQKLVNEVLTWIDSPAPNTPKRLFAHMTFNNMAVPDWMQTIPGMDDIDTPVPLTSVSMILQRAHGVSV
jgi:hypothetical protein